MGVAVFLAICIAICIYLSPHFETVIKDPEYLRRIAESKGALAIPAFLILQILQVVVALIPGEALEIGAGAAFGPFWGFLLAQLGVAIGTVIIFVISRRLGKRFIESITGGRQFKRFSRLDKSPHRDRIIFLIFFIPGLPKDALTYAAAFFDVSAARFLSITLIARIPSVLSSTIAADFLISENYPLALAIFIVTGIVSVLCFLLSEKILAKIEKTK